MSILHNIAKGFLLKKLIANGVLWYNSKAKNELSSDVSARKTPKKIRVQYWQELKLDTLIVNDGGKTYLVYYVDK